MALHSVRTSVFAKPPSFLSYDIQASNVLHHCLPLNLSDLADIPVVHIVYDLIWKQSTGLNLGVAGGFHVLQILLDHTGLSLESRIITPLVHTCMIVGTLQDLPEGHQNLLPQTVTDSVGVISLLNTFVFRVQFSGKKFLGDALAEQSGVIERGVDGRVAVRRGDFKQSAKISEIRSCKNR
ncbi:hypothetical protein Pyn_40877 [Prunus yedoensis var. nudiflora]|uniref:Uncharacterized protein n=1 Tax=Prunus yedoensis var. nudiflora TaxID=2094558 RepID=A0A314Y5I3_PRUYE|nr:hypothetical protein Pyn_40877 [Prunus yedoensis var. nudiflora]